MEQRRATDALLVEIKEGQAQLIAELNKNRDSISFILIRYAAYIIPFLVMLFTTYNLVKSSEREIRYLQDISIKTEARVKLMEDKSSRLDVWRKELELNQRAIQQIVKDLQDKN